jgi:hypothetical protein
MNDREAWLDDLHPEAYRTLVEGVPAGLSHGRVIVRA